MTPTIRQTVKEVFLILLVFLAVGACIIVFFVGGGLGKFIAGGCQNTIKIRMLLGYILGIAMSMGMFYHIAYIAERAVVMEANAASKRVTLYSMLRMIIALILMTAAYISGWFSIIGMLIGAILMRPAVSLQPLVHRLLRRENAGCGEQSSEGEENAANYETYETESGSDGKTTEAPTTASDASEYDPSGDDWEENPPAFVKWLERKTYKHGNYGKRK